MQTLSKKDYQLFKSIVKLPTEKLQKVLTKYLQKNYGNAVSSNGYTFAAGDIPICLAAHMDTVFDDGAMPKESDIFYDREKNTIWSRQGGCGDDRSGVFAIIKIIESGLRPSVIFTDFEEEGCVGAMQLVDDLPQFPTKLNYIIQLDRRGTNDCVFYNCANDSFTEYIEKFGFVENFGSFSDISELCPAWKIAGVNLSIGYDGEHSVSEIVQVNSLLATINKVKIMLKEKNIPEFPYIAAYPELDGFLRESFYDDDTGLVVCSGCGRTIRKYDAIPAVGEDGKTEKYFCYDCAADGYIKWCAKCGRPFERINQKDVLCPDCRKESKHD